MSVLDNGLVMFYPLGRKTREVNVSRSKSWLPNLRTRSTEDEAGSMASVTPTCNITYSYVQGPCFCFYRFLFSSLFSW